MATKSGFKQQCPHCEARVPIKDEAMIGEEINCPKCKKPFVVEDPDDAEWPSMPRNALKRDHVDHVVPLDAMAALLASLSREEAAPSIPLPQDYIVEDKISAQEFAVVEPDINTPGQPSRSNLSIARKAVSRWRASVTPCASNRPSSSLRLLIFSTAEPAGRPAATRPSAAMAMISASASGRAEPTVSASHWTNSRKRPGPGFSLRHTGP